MDLNTENKKKNKVLIIIPAYNEEQAIGAVLDKLAEPGISGFADVLVPVWW